MNDAMERLRSRQSRPAPPAANVLDAIMQPRPVSQGDIIRIPGGKLHGFDGHTFKLRADDDPYMVSLADSIRENGILEPLLVRPHPVLAGEYEVIAGHTRHYLGDKAGMADFPCLVKRLDDADAVIQMGESNVQRPDWLPSEKARTYKAHLEAIRVKRREVRPGRTLPEEPRGEVRPGRTFDMNGEKSREIAAKRWGIAGQVLERYIKLNDLHPGLLELVDAGRIPVKAGFQLAFLSADDQAALLELLQANPAVKVNEALAKELRTAQREEFTRVLGLEKSRPARRPVWTVALPRELLPDRAKEYLAEPELQERLAAVVRDYMTERKGEV